MVDEEQWLGGGWTTPLKKNMYTKFDHLPKSHGKNQRNKRLEHHQKNMSQDNPKYILMPNATLKAISFLNFNGNSVCE